MSKPAPSATGSESRLVKVLDDYLAAAQRGDPPDKSALLAAHPELADDLEACLASLDFIRRAAASGTADVPAGHHPGDDTPTGLLGDFRIVREAGRGGMGVVYEAEQVSLGRRVALKVLPFAAALDPRQLARFRVEAQAAAQLHHTNIVPVHSVGVERGVHYYAMQFIDGRSLAEVVRELREARAGSEPPDRSPLGASTSGRPFFEAVARLGVQAAEALEYAHSLGIVHRDVKPANLLLDARGTLWVTDFGLARLHADAGLTMTGDVLGTLRYMSPEQALARRVLIDQRTDVYSLGVTLYELLTLRPAFDGLDRQELLRQIAFEEPPAPRRVDPAVPRELETVVLKAMEKEPEGRYGSAQELADDLRRYLEHRPIKAKRPTLVERAAKWSRRHATAVGAAALVLLLSVVGLAVSNRMIARRNAEILRKSAEVERQRDEIKRALKESEEIRQRAEDAEKTARAEADKAKAVNDFLTKDLLTQADPENNAIEDKVTLLEVVDRAADKVGDRFHDQPEAESALRMTLADTYHGLGVFTKAEQQAQAALNLEQRHHGPEAAGTFRALENLGHMRDHLGRSSEALELLRQASEGLQRTLGSDHPQTLASRHNLAQAYLHAGRTAEAIALDEGTLELREAKLGPDDPETLASRGNLATAYFAAGRTAEAIALHEETLKLRTVKLGPDHPSALVSRGSLASAYLQAGRTDQAIALCEGLLKPFAAKLGPDHPHTLACRTALATAYLAAGRTDEAIALHEETLKLRTAKLGPDHPETLASRNGLAVAYNRAGRTAEAIALHKQTLKLRTAKLGPDHPDTLTSRNNLAVAYQDAGRMAEAIALDEETLKMRTSKLGPNHPETLLNRNNLAAAYLDAGRTAEAIALHEATLTLMERQLGPDHPDTLTSRNNLAVAYERAGRTAEAIALNEETLKLRTVKLGPDHPRTLTSCDNLAAAYESLGRWADAASLRRDGLARRRKAEKPDSPLLAGDLALFGHNLLKQAKWSEAETVLRECLAICETKLSDDWRRFHTMSQLGGALLGQGRYAEAEPLTTQGYEGMKARAAQIPPLGQPRLSEAAERVIQLYEAWGQPEKAAVWRARLGLADLPADLFAGP
jgi:tetratricopeptide (TPR) repeat protein/tRNA A-37 threonylcarbamoyl transferase component Bud32